MEGKFCVETAKSNRAACKRCKEKIGKDELRIGTKSKMNDIETVAWNHAKCFKIPKKATAEDILQYLEGFDQLNDGQQEIVKSFLEEASVPAPSSSSKKRGSDASSLSSPKGKRSKSTDDGEVSLRKIFNFIAAIFPFGVKICVGIFFQHDDGRTQRLPSMEQPACYRHKSD